MFDIEKVEYINSSAIFAHIEKELDVQGVSQLFSEMCDDVTYGDASYTLVLRSQFFQILSDALFDIPGIDNDKLDDVLYSTETWFRGRCEYVNLEA